MKESLPNTLEIYDWHTPATEYPEKEIAPWRIHRTRQWYGHYYYWGMDDYLFWRVRKPIPITLLQEWRGRKWHDWMVDDPPQQRAMEIYAEHAHGRVLCAGLGLGLVLWELAKNPKVTQVAVVEKSLEVMQLVLPQLTPLFHYQKGKCLFNILEEDFYDFIRDDTNQWDTIIADLWVTSGKTKMDVFLHEVLPTAVELGAKYPGAEITFHGFQSISHVKPVGEEAIEKIKELGRYYGR